MTTNIEGDKTTAFAISPEYCEHGFDKNFVRCKACNGELIYTEEQLQSEISKREALLLDELEEAVGNAKYGEDQGFNYEQAVDDVYDFINAKRGKK